ncbi:Adenine phosphoribosyltransferase 1, chloroplastic-like protein [Gossypium australe]|uniref:Adenine phosphoribosyltransferase 1, chloroplastic-like protein n=1 Tax=Gossypium australe TaxID=47621 RepID=A0A5B6VHH2_9ROSI|nr:Adenine phosphoribosyltransferase 1, chloroplastic-like protein [Gossypium australe]
MAGICGPNPILHLHRTTTQSPLNLQRVHGGARWCCCSVSPENENKTRTPPLLRLAVSGVTELLRLFSSSAQGNRADYQLKTEDRDENSASDIDDVLRILKADYENAYFVTGKELYSRNLKLLVPFFDSPSIRLQKIEKGANMETDFVAATWRLRTYLKLPWRPLISVNGSTIYELDEKLKIVRHSESWDVTALEAIGQIFTPSIGRPNE